MMFIIIVNASVLFAILSVYFDNNISQLAGFILIFLSTFYLKPNYYLCFFVIVLSFFILIFDSSAMGSKTIILLYIYYSYFRINQVDFDFKFNKITVKILFFISLLLTAIQISSGIGNTGFGALVRGSMFFWDPNYFVILLLLIRQIYLIPIYIVLTYMLLGQTLTSFISFVVYKIKPNFNLFLLIILIFFYFFMTQIDLSFVPQDSWLSERIYSFSIRVNMLNDFIDGDILDGSAPHMSFLSGYKKNPISTIIFFLLIPFISKDKYFLWMLIVISMTYDVFFGPACFLVPLAVNLNYIKKY
jgi:hypothetical protein